MDIKNNDFHIQTQGPELVIKDLKNPNRTTTMYKFVLERHIINTIRKLYRRILDLQNIKEMGVNLYCEHNRELELLESAVNKVYDENLDEMDKINEERANKKMLKDRQKAIDYVDESERYFISPILRSMDPLVDDLNLIISSGTFAHKEIYMHLNSAKYLLENVHDSFSTVIDLVKDELEEDDWL